MVVWVVDDYYSSEINHGRLYPHLDTLVEKGLVDKNKKDDRTNCSDDIETGDIVFDSI